MTTVTESRPTLEEKLKLATRTPVEEVVTLEELRRLFETKEHPTHYVGLEISGLLHIGTLIINGMRINDLIKAGVDCRVFLADWHTFINKKVKGDWEKISSAARYYAEAFTFYCPGVKIVFGSDLYHNNDEYWRNYMRFSREVTLARVSRCLTILGRSEREKLEFAQYLYPPLQAVDIKEMDLDIVQSGIDQRKVHMLTREVFPTLRWKKPVAIHHHLLPALGEPTKLGLDENSKLDEVISSKMSKSKPSSAIFVHDNPEEIEAKIGKAWCPEGRADGNPILEYLKYLVFPLFERVEVERPQKYGGDVSFESYEELERRYLSGKIHPADLKRAVANYVDRIISPVRSFLANKEDLYSMFSTNDK
jgi:tyrosyl-tRNA synthetase